MVWTFVVGSPESDFLTQNPELRYVPFIKRIIESGKDVNAIMWSLYLVEDPRSKLYQSTEHARRITAVEERYKIKYEDDCVSYIEQYRDACMGPKARMWKMLQESLHKDIIDMQGMAVKDRLDLYGKLANIQKSFKQAEEDYKKEMEEMGTEIQKRAAGSLQPGLFNQKKNN